MSRNTEYQFISTDTDTLTAAMVSAYEAITGTSVTPASPEKLFISWVTDIIIQERALCNYAANQNIPSRAEGDNLDALGELFFAQERPQAQAATTTVRFTISEAQGSAVLVPSGTRVTDTSQTLVWETTDDAYIPAGDTTIDLAVTCQTLGIAGNGYVAGQIVVAVDLFSYYLSCANTTTSDGGADVATDDEFYELLIAGQDAYSTAGARGGYIYHAKLVSTEISDIVVTNPDDGVVTIYVLMSDGSIASSEIKAAVLAACSDAYVRPLTDSVTVEDPDEVNYNIAFTYYISTDSDKSSTEIATAVAEAVDEYITWQSGKLGRDVNPSYLHGLLMQTGIKRVVLTSPVYTVLDDGSTNDTPEVVAVGTVTITNGGYENE